MRVSVFGMGYVGSTLAACLASDGHTVLAVEPDQSRADLLRRGCLPFVESRLEKTYQKHSASIHLVESPASAVVDSELTFVCVGTPLGDNGLDMRYMRTAAEQIGDALASKADYHAVVVKSTVPPGTTRHMIGTVLAERSGKRLGADFGLIFNPEFLREGNAVEDYYYPPFTVIGTDTTSDQQAVRLLRDVYEWVRANVVLTDYETAEMLKLVCNAFHAIKVAFANEIGNLCRAGGIDSRSVMDIFCRDTYLNLSSYYLKPGFAFGGSCLPKDVAALCDMAEYYDLATPLLKSILPSNDDQIEQAALATLRAKPQTVGILGLAHKPGTNDLRDSPAIKLADLLRRSGCTVRPWDENGQGGAYSLVDALQSDVVILASKAVNIEAVQSMVSDRQTVVDLARVLDGAAFTLPNVVRLV